MASILPLLGDDLELDAARRSCIGREATDARRELRATIEAPGERGVLVARHVAELAATPGNAHGVRIVRVVALALELEPVANAQLVPDLGRGVIAKAGQRRALHDQGCFL